MQSQKWQNVLTFVLRQTIQVAIIQVYAPTTNTEKAEVDWFLWRPTTPSRIHAKTRCPFHHIGLESKSRKSRDTQNNRQVWPWSTQWSRAMANRVLLREHTGRSKLSFPSHPRNVSTLGHHQMVNTKIRLIILLAAKDGEALCSQQKQDLELSMAQIISSLLQNSGLNRRK